MSNANKRKGTAWESAIRDTLRQQGFDIERLTLNGTQDEGDLVLKAGQFRLILEAKNRKQINLAQFAREAVVEADNYVAARPGLKRDRVVGLAVIKRQGVSDPLQSYVLTTLGEFLGLGPDGLA